MFDRIKNLFRPTGQTSSSFPHRSTPDPGGDPGFAPGAAATRLRSRKLAAELGYPDPTSLPLLEAMELRDIKQITDRFFALHLVSSAAWGFDYSRAKEWLAREQLTQALSPAEMEFLTTEDGHEDFQDGPEALWALAWTLSLIPTLDFSRPSSNDFIRMLPNLKKMEPPSGLKGTPRLRPKEEVLEALDLAYCLHWGIVEAGLRRRKIPGKVPAYVIVERRKALEWCLSDEEWDEISLDT